MPERSHRNFLKIFMFPFNYFDSQNTLQATFNLSPGISESMTGVREWGRVIKEGLKARDLYVILKTGPASHLLPFLIPIPPLPSLHACTIHLVSKHLSWYLVYQVPENEKLPAQQDHADL